MQGRGAGGMACSLFVAKATTATFNNLAIACGSLR